MPYYKHLSACFGCYPDVSGYPIGSGRLPSAFLSNDMVITTDFEPSSSGILHTLESKCTKYAPLFSVQDLSLESDPNTKYRVFVDTRDFSFAPRATDAFLVPSGGEIYRYRITSVTTA